MRDPIDVIAEICQLQPPDALEQIACALGYTPEKAPRFAATATRVKRSGGPKKITMRVHDDSPLWDFPAGTVTRLYLIPAGVMEARRCGSHECKAAQRDGVICADDECRDADGVRACDGGQQG